MEPMDNYRPTDISTGLTDEEVSERIRLNRTNAGEGIRTKTEKQIILENTFTYFNILNFVLAALILLVGSYKNLLFMGVIVSNTVIGSFQGIRAKRTIDKLSLISAPKVTALRNKKLVTIHSDNIVIDDIMRLSNGQQLCADAVIRNGEVEVNESLVTGESDPVTKKSGDMVLSGSFVVSGTCLAQAVHIGAENYSSKIANGAKYIKPSNSQIMLSLNAIVKVIGAALIPIGIFLFAKQYFFLHDTVHDAVVTTVAALIGMIPEGLILLTSVVFAVSVVRLSKYKTLVQDLYCTESLARVDVLCLDKTGTITEGRMQVDELLPLEGHSSDEMQDALNALSASLSDSNPTSDAVRARFDSGTDWLCDATVPFSSKRKWSGAHFNNHGTYVMGAGEFILRDSYSAVSGYAESFSASGQRVLLLAHSADGFGPENSLPNDINPIGFIIISDMLRPDAGETLAYFAEQGVSLKIISGDSVSTVKSIAKRAGMHDAENACDASELITEADTDSAVEKFSVFGRVTPEQKLQFVQALKRHGHTVAMTGDGVNDVLALKEADCSIAMASGSDAARTVSNLVLLDSNFSSMPHIVKEGRRSINNLQRSASLFLQKTIFSSLLGIFFLFIAASYPFQPIQLTFISTITIGIPSFILALEPNTDRINGIFLSNVIKRSVPSALVLVASILFLTLFRLPLGLSDAELSTLCVSMAFIAGFALMYKLCVPFTRLRAALFFTMLAATVIGFLFFHELFALVPLNLHMLLVFAPTAASMLILLLFSNRFLEKLTKKYADDLLSAYFVKKRK